MTTIAESLLTIKAVMDRIGFSRAKIYSMMADDTHPFPKPIKVGGTKSVRWLESAVNRWILEEAEAADGEAE